MLDGEKDGHELKRKDRRSKIKDRVKGKQTIIIFIKYKAMKDKRWAGGKVVSGEWRGRGKAKGLEDIE